MAISELSFLVVVIFMVHEFEEIICVKRWIAKHERDSRFAKEMFIKGKANYPSTESIAIMILEEFLLLSAIFFYSAKAENMYLAVAVFAIYTLHLFGHIFDAARFKNWTPGSRTAVLQLPFIFYIFYEIFSGVNFDLKKLAVYSAVMLVVMVLNLKLIHLAGAKILK